MDYCTRTFLDCYVDACMGLRSAIKEASKPIKYSWDDPLFWEKSAIDWLKQALQNYRQLEREFENASK